MVIWAEALDRIVPLCQDIEERLIKLLWRARPVAAGQSPSLGASQMSAYSGSAHGSLADHGGSSDTAHPMSPATFGSLKRGLYGEQGRGLEPEETQKLKNEKSKGSVENMNKSERRWTRTWYGKKVLKREAVSTRDEDADLEGLAVLESERRPVRLYAPLYNGLAAAIALGGFCGCSLWFQ